MRAVTIIFNGIEWVAETRVIGMTIRGFGDTQTHACKDLLRACRQFPSDARPDLPGDLNDRSLTRSEGLLSGRLRSQPLAAIGK